MTLDDPSRVRTLAPDDLALLDAWWRAAITLTNQQPLAWPLTTFLSPVLLEIQPVI